MRIYKAKAVCVDLETTPKTGTQYAIITFRIDDDNNTDHAECFTLICFNEVMIEGVLEMFQNDIDSLDICVAKINNHFTPVTFNKETGEYVVIQQFR